MRLEQEGAAIQNLTGQRRSLGIYYSKSNEKSNNDLRFRKIGLVAA